MIVLAARRRGGIGQAAITAERLSFGIGRWLYLVGGNAVHLW